MESKRLCPYCMQELTGQAESCPHCGRALNRNDGAFCQFCGQSLEPEEEDRK